MTNPFIIERRASCFESIFPRIDEKNWLWAADVFEELGRPSAAARARRLAAEFRMLADRLDGIVPVGAGEDDAEVTASAIAFGGPLPGGSAAA